jgi:murein DD-endopeptidase MepM/ murein hydrolase activator NlpD
MVMRLRGLLTAASAMVLLALAGCGSSATGGGAGGGAGAGPRAHPQVVEPEAGGPVVPDASSGAPPVGDVHAHAPPLSEIRRELALSVVQVSVTSNGYINPLRYVTAWGRTDQGVDAAMPVGAPILAPGPVKILAVEPDWYAGQPLVYFELLNGVDAGQVQYVAEQITDIARPGTTVSQGEPIARFAARGTDIEYGWSTLKGVTLAVATTGYEEGQVTPAGKYMRAWLNALGANAGDR